jgi:hypothetical protein
MYIAHHYIIIHSVLRRALPIGGADRIGNAEMLRLREERRRELIVCVNALTRALFSSHEDFHIAALLMCSTCICHVMLCHV